MAKKKVEPLEVEEAGAWAGYGFLQGIIKSASSKPKVNIQYATEQADGAVSLTTSWLFKAIAKLEAGPAMLWTVRPIWKKKPDDTWEVIIPARNSKDPKEAPRWTQIDFSQGFVAFAGNLLAGPRGKAPYLKLPATTLAKLRFGTITPKVRSGLTKAVEDPGYKTMVQCRKAVGARLVNIILELHKTAPGILGYSAFTIAGQWAILDHILTEAKEFDKGISAKVRKIFKGHIDRSGLPGVDLALEEAVVMLSNDPNYKKVFDLTRKKVFTSLEAYLVEIVYSVLPQLQQVFAREGRHKFSLIVKKKVMGLEVKKSDLVKEEGKVTLQGLPTFNSKGKRRFLKDRVIKNRLYHTLRAVSAKPDKMPVGFFSAFRFGGSNTGHNSTPVAVGEEVMPFNASILKCLQMAVQENVSAPTLWAGRFPKDLVSMHTGIVNAEAVSGYTGLNVSAALRGFIHNNVMTLAAPLMFGKNTAKAQSISQIVTRLTLNTADTRSTARILVAKQLQSDKLSPTERALYSIIQEACHENVIHAAFWTTSLLLKFAAETEDTEAFNSLGSILRQELANAKTGKMRRWLMFKELENNLSVGLISFASLEIAKRSISAENTKA